MKYSYNWLKDYLKDLPSPEVLSSDLTTLGTEVEEISYGIDSLVVTSKIIEIKPHPNADKLRMVIVEDNNERYEVVCGAPNIEIGQIVPLAKLGAKVANITISEAEIRGQKSKGMLCSEKELGLSENHTGIMVLPVDTEVGKPLNEILKLSATLQAEVTPNRGDLLSHLGLARELGAKYNKVINKEPISLSMDSQKISDQLNIEVKDTKNCPKYYARIIKGVTIKDSPDWLKARLVAVGLSPINNVVDITNYIMLDLGQPLHAFNFQALKDNKIIVRAAADGEIITALDDKDYQLSKDNLVIADSEKPVAIAGVMGGLNSGITNETQDIVLEAAVFNPKSIRKTAKTLNLPSDASYRFERGVDANLLEYALNKAANLIKETAGGKILAGICKSEIETRPICVEIDYQKINNYLDLNLPNEEINQLLRRFCFEISDAAAIIPSFRHDIENWQDLCEEVGRLYGVDKLARILLPEAKKTHRSNYYFKEWLKDQLVAKGFVESISYPFMSEADAVALLFDTKGMLQVKNPVQPENKYMRPSLFAGLAKLVAKNSSFGLILAFEIGQVFSKTSEMTNLSIMVASGSQKEALYIINLIKKDFPEIIFNLVEQDKFKYKFRKNFVYFSEIDIDKLGKYRQNTTIAKPKSDIYYRQVSKYPSAVRDIALVVDAGIKSNEVASEIYSTSQLVNRVELFDEFKSEKLGSSKKSLAFHLDMQDLNKTLTDSEADDVVKNIVSRLAAKYKAILRS